MDRSTPGNFIMGRKRGKDCWSLRMGMCILGSSSRTKWKGTASTSGLTGKSTSASGTKAKSMASGSSPGKTAESTTESIATIKRTGKEYSNGRTEEDTRASGVMGSSTGWGGTRMSLGRRRKEPGLGEE